MIKTSVLPNGLRVISRAQPQLRSAAVGVWLQSGVRHQPPGHEGYAHLLEHLLFRGTCTLDAHALARRFAAMGSQVNAQTGRELTALYAHVPGGEVPELVTLFGEMLIGARFDEADVALERQVILQEMAALASDPAEALEETAIATVWNHHPIAGSVLGRREALERASAGDLREHLSAVSVGQRLQVVAAGAVDHVTLEEACRGLAALPPGTAPRTTVPPRFMAATLAEERTSQQHHLLWLMPVPASRDPAYPALVLTNHLLGGDTVSRLFAEVRTARGLAYGIHSRLEFYSDTGLWLIHCACSPGCLAECAAVVEQTIVQLIHHGPTSGDLEQARQGLAARLLLADDDPQSAMERLARESFYLGRHPSLADYQNALARARPSDVRASLAQGWSRVARATTGPPVWPRPGRGVR